MGTAFSYVIFWLVDIGRIAGNEFDDLGDHSQQVESLQSSTRRRRAVSSYFPAQNQRQGSARQVSSIQVVADDACF